MESVVQVLLGKQLRVVSVTVCWLGVMAIVMVMVVMVWRNNTSSDDIAILVDGPGVGHKVVSVVE